MPECILLIRFSLLEVLEGRRLLTFVRLFTIEEKYFVSFHYETAYSLAFLKVGRAQYRCTATWLTPNNPSLITMTPTTSSQNVFLTLGLGSKLQVKTQIRIKVAR